MIVRTALFLSITALVACSTPSPVSGDAGAEASDASVDAGDADGGSAFDGGLGLCSTCGVSPCNEGLECRLVGGGFGYCARFLPICPGVLPDIVAVNLEYGRACRWGGAFCSVRARLEMSDGGVVASGQSVFVDGGMLATLARGAAPESVAAWRPLAIGCYATDFVFPDDGCLTHSDYFVLKFELSDGGATGLEFSGGSSTLPSRSFIGAVVSVVQAAERALDGGP